jgi:hypothetical protein
VNSSFPSFFSKRCDQKASLFHYCNKMRAIHYTLLVSIWLSYGVSSIPFQGSGANFMKNVLSEWSNALKYRKYDLDQYREEISSKVTESIENFRKDQLVAQSVAQKDLDSYMEKFNQMYARNLATLEKQKIAVDEMRKRMEISRPPNIDDSLEQFRKFYNESIVVGPYEMVSKQWRWSTIEKKTFDPKMPQESLFEESLIKQTERLREMLRNEWINAFKVPEKKSKSKRKAWTIETTVRSAASDLNKLQEELTLNARQLALSTQNAIKTTIDKKDVRRETRNLEEQLMKLNREGNFQHYLSE